MATMTPTILDDALSVVSSPGAASDDTFSYEPLHNDGQIRILELHPSADPGSPLSGDLSTEYLDSVAPYEAISYVWGSPAQTHALHLTSATCSNSLPLTSSIHDALHRLRLPDRPRRLWADQVCINQADLAERSRQVRLMNRIYRGAAEVLVWLGSDDTGAAEQAAETIQWLSEVFKDEKKLEVFKREHLDELGQRSGKAWVPLATLTRLPWFNRVWIVQEIGTAAPATLYWGPSVSFSWSVLFSVSSILGQEFHPLRARFQIFTPNITYLYQRFVRPQDSSHLPAPSGDLVTSAMQLYNRDCFIYELHRARHLLAKDPRDHVYAFLGHFSLQIMGEALAGLVPDYSRPLDEVYVDVAVRALRGPSALQVLSACQATSTKSRTTDSLPDSGMPSWVPDWRHLPIHVMGPPAAPHRAAGDSVPRLEIDENQRLLRIAGERIDTISRRSWTFFSLPFVLRQVTPATANRRRRPKMSSIEALWEYTCGFASRPISLEPRYQDDGGDGYENSALFALAQTLTNGCIGLDRSRPYSTIPPLEWLSHAAAYLAHQLPFLKRPLSDSIIHLAPDGDAFRWSREATLVSRHRRFAVTSSRRYYVLGPEALEEGDQVVVLRGGCTPFVLRQMDNGRWKLLGECYVHGLMNGEGFSDERGREEWFTIA